MMFMLIIKSKELPKLKIASNYQNVFEQALVVDFIALKKEKVSFFQNFATIKKDLDDFSEEEKSKIKLLLIKEVREMIG